MPVFGTKATDYLEEIGCNFLKKLPDYKEIKRNNLEIISNPDYVNGLDYGDCQASGDFAKWGEIRIDTISACDYKDHIEMRKMAKREVFNFSCDSFESYLRSLLKINKLGKAFANIGFILYFVYDYKVKTLSDVQVKPRFVLMMDMPKFKNLLNSKWKEFVAKGCLLFNNKEYTPDDFGSAFLAIDKSQLSVCLTDLTKLYNEM